MNSTFASNVPLRRSIRPTDLHKQAPSLLFGAYMKAIIVDDSRTDSYIAAQVARTYFDEVEVYGTPLELHTALAKQQLPDLILMDLHIGALHNGISELDTIRKQNNEASVIPIIMVTASTNVVQHNFAMEIGASAVIAKPLTKEKLAPLLSYLIPQIVVEGK